MIGKFDKKGIAGSLILNTNFMIEMKWQESNSDLFVRQAEDLSLSRNNGMDVETVKNFLTC